MRPGGGGSKGAAFERSVCTRLSLWVSGGKSQDLFWRSAMSGGRANLRQRRKKAGQFRAHAGDIVATHKAGLPLVRTFCIDTKFLRKFELDARVFGTDGEFWRDWVKLCEEARRFRKLPLLIGRSNRRGEFVALCPSGALLLADERAFQVRRMTLHSSALDPTPSAEIFATLTQFLALVDYRSLALSPSRVKLEEL